MCLVAENICLSIIVPLYNAEDYLEHTIDSLLNSGVITSNEILLIDDGSTDQSSLVCDRYASEYKHISCLHLAHGGLPEARVRGMLAAKGNYITFVDSDDFVESGVYDDVLQIMQEDKSIDIGITGAVRCYPDGSEEELFPEAEKNDTFIFTHEEALREMVSWKKFAWHMWGKVYRRKLFDGFDPDRNVTTSEDLLSNWELFHKANKVCLSTRHRYHYLLHAGSMTETAEQINRYRSDLLVYEQILQDDRLSDVEIKNRILSFKVQALCDLTRSLVFEEGEMEQALHYANETRDTLKSMHDRSFLVPDVRRRAEAIEADVRGYIDKVGYIRTEVLERVKQIKDTYSDVYICGTGIVARHVLRLCSKSGLNITAFLISDGQRKQESYGSRPVLYFSEVPINTIENGFLLAVNPKNQMKISENLHNIGHRNIIKLPVADVF